MVIPKVDDVLLGALIRQLVRDWRTEPDNVYTRQILSMALELRVFRTESNVRIESIEIEEDGPPTRN